MLHLLAIALLQPAGALDLVVGVDHTTRLLEGERASAFELGRAEVGARLQWDFVRAEARFETVRSAQPQSLFGIDGNSLVVRARRVAVGVEASWGPLEVGGRVGLLADPFLDRVEQGFDLRDLTALSAQELLDPADLGAQVRLDAWDQRLGVGVGFGNGEGATEGERNDGVDLTAVAYGVPWRGQLFDAPAEARLVAFWRDGSRGAGAVQSDRLGAAATARTHRGSIGVSWVQAQGFADRAQREVTDLAAWANFTLLPGWFGALGQYTRTDLDSTQDAIRQRISAGLYLEPRLSGATPDQRLRLYLTWSRLTFGPDAGPVAGVPEAVDQDILLVRLALAHTLGVSP